MRARAPPTRAADAVASDLTPAAPRPPPSPSSRAQDDFQLLNYINEFKGLQLFTGIYLVIRGVLDYVSCAGVTWKLSEYDDFDSGEHAGYNGYRNRCELDGPGASSEEGYCGRHGRLCAYLRSVDFLGQVALVWIAFALLPYSHCQVNAIFMDHRLVGATILVRKNNVDGERRRARVLDWDAKTWEHEIEFAAEPDVIHRVALERVQFKVLKLPGANLDFKLSLLVWDMLVVACIVLPGAFFIFWWGRELAFWQRMAIIYWGKAFYQLLSLPFLLMKIPFFMRLVTQTRKTGYDEHGKLRPHRKQMMDRHRFSPKQHVVYIDGPDGEDSFPARVLDEEDGESLFTITDGRRPEIRNDPPIISGVHANQLSHARREVFWHLRAMRAENKDDKEERMCKAPDCVWCPKANDPRTICSPASTHQVRTASGFFKTSPLSSPARSEEKV